MYVSKKQCLAQLHHSIHTNINKLHFIRLHVKSRNKNATNNRPSDPFLDKLIQHPAHFLPEFHEIWFWKGCVIANGWLCFGTWQIQAVRPLCDKYDVVRFEMSMVIFAFSFSTKLTVGPENTCTKKQISILVRALKHFRKSILVTHTSYSPKQYLTERHSQTGWQ